MKIIAFTGAGISKASGIPTFEEMPGIRDYLTRNYFQEEPQEFYQKLWQMYERISQAEPNPAHLALARYQIPVITMNIDGLHRKAGTKELVEIHGNLDYVFCPVCQRQYPFTVVKDKHFCSDCREVLQPNVVLYGDWLAQLPQALELVADAELLLVIGTSFYTSTARYVTERARLAGARVEVINAEAEKVLPELLDRLFNAERHA